MPGTRKLGRTSEHRTAMLRGMVTLLLDNGKIETTVTRAKEVRSLAEKMITIGKVNSLYNKRIAFSFITKNALFKCSTHFSLDITFIISRKILI